MQYRGHSVLPTLLVFCKITCKQLNGEIKYLRVTVQKVYNTEFCGEKYIFDVFKEVYFAFLHVSLIMGQVIKKQGFHGFII